MREISLHDVASFEWDIEMDLEATDRCIDAQGRKWGVFRKTGAGWLGVNGIGMIYFSAHEIDKERDTIRIVEETRDDYVMRRVRRQEAADEYRRLHRAR